MIGFKYSKNYKAAGSRIHRLPKLVGPKMDTYIKKRAERLVELFHDGIKQRKLRLKPLTENTIKRKERLGYSEPETPLYGVGDDDPRHTYANMMKIRRRLKGTQIRYTVAPSNAKHHGSKLRLRQLFVVHEYGTTINNAFGVSGRVVRIPPRPAFRYAYRRLMAEMARQDPVPKVRAAMAKLVKTGDQAALKKIAERK